MTGRGVKVTRRLLLHVTMRLKTPAFCFFRFFDTTKRLEAIMRLVLHSSQVLKNDYCQKKFFSVLVKKYKKWDFFLTLESNPPCFSKIL
jgi:hypothetical protein